LHWLQQHYSGRRRHRLQQNGVSAYKLAIGARMSCPTSFAVYAAVQVQQRAVYANIRLTSMLRNERQAIYGTLE
jgi:hypothetical protein